MRGATSLRGTALDLV